ncbi:MAG: AAA family ATPase [Bacillota bacterium]
MTRNLLEKIEAGELSIIESFKKLNSSNLALQEDNYSVPTQNKLNQIKAELDNLIGLEKIKKLVAELEAFVKVQQRRRQKRLATEPLVMHMVFKGNPGTGKTTVARIFGKLFKELGLLSEGHLTEVERADLVGEYIGHTAQKTKDMIKEALGGILFIDEAYSLARGGVRDFGKESIDALVKGMEDHRDNLIIILAGYPQEMEDFLQTNPGLNSRFPITVEFEDYTLEELVKIAELMLQEREYKLSKKAKNKLYRLLAKERSNRGADSGNARTVRNLMERAIRLQASRIINEQKSSRRDLMMIQPQDFRELDEE